MRELTETERALAAMNRAAATARKRASRFGSKLVMWRNGSVVLVDPRANGAEQDGAEQTATAVDSKAKGQERFRPESEGRSQ
jgi:hypothetical protein